ncbi:carboxypeptidase-like regulatory domain-containing protein [Ulvibacterium marinum]|uniref:Carboxypeptidase-like regulatory domain-containing protein n=1 Tax=Ulvibacterium marinum TaxID=2419782 RepID=A0A3B0C6W5_9FLAO|nr:carboxypeptidase-like regulatory domain-containing protein [Ulvibacterium marinum]RKN79929.1 carboxypeptidase-like regulatory domain-containing protein [Ulvibacterium marinum]
MYNCSDFHMISKNIKWIHYFFMCFYGTMVFCQDDFIRGKLQDARTGEPVVFATIRIKDKAVGVISNQDGGFRIPKKFKELGDILIISSMGYQKKEIPITGLAPEAINIIRLSQGVLELSEAVVTAKKKRRLTARKIVRKAIETIPMNYPQNSFSLVGYYRDYQLNQENDYVNLNEAILEAFDLGFDMVDSATTKVKIYNYKKNTDFKRDEVADAPYNYKTWQKIINKAYLFNYGGNEFTILRIHDAIRNFKINSFDFVNQLENDFLNNHFFDKDDDVYLDGQALYSIRFKNSKSGLTISGRLIISKENYAIYKMEYAVYDGVKGKRLGKSNKDGNKKQLVFKVVSEYKPKYGKMYLNYISFHNSFLLGMPPRFVVDNIYLDDLCKCFTVRFNEIVDAFSAKKKKNYSFVFNGKKISISKIIPYLYTVELYPRMTERQFASMKSETEKVIRNLELGQMKTSEATIKGFGDIDGDLYIYKAKLDSDIIEEGWADMFQVEMKAGSFKVDMPKTFKVTIEELKDIYGFLLNKRVYKEYKQFREFFVQQALPGQIAPGGSLFMNKRKPIFEDQPIAKPNNSTDYWMNTPLKKAN